MIYDFGYFHYDVAFVVVGWVENLQNAAGSGWHLVFKLLVHD